MTMRLPKSEAIYQQAIKDKTLIPLYDEDAVYDFKYWKIVENRFKHDKFATTNHMIVLKREAAGLKEIKPLEWLELMKIVIEVRNLYDSFMYNFPNMSSIKNIPHAHLYKVRKEYK